MEMIQKPLKTLEKLVDWATHSHKKRIYYFSEGSAEDKNILGNKVSPLIIHLMIAFVFLNIIKYLYLHLIYC